MITVLLVIGILVLLILGHELGHFIAAKIFKVRVEEFGVGYPPRAFIFGKFGGTEYTLNWLPFGGFVRLFGDDGDVRHGPGGFTDARRSVQAVILVAGVFANAVLAWGLFAGALAIGVPRVVDSTQEGEKAQLIVADVVPGSPADAAGMMVGDEIVGLTYESNSLEEFTPESVLDFVRTRGGKEILLSYMRAGTTTEVILRPAHAVIAEEAGRPAVGVALVLVSSSPLGWREAIRESSLRTLDAFKAVGNGLWAMLKKALVGEGSLSDVVGPVGLVGVVSEAATHGFGNVLALAAFISVNLAVINLIPIPALDGGRLLLLGVETVMRRNVPRLVVQLLNLAGFVLIALLMFAVTYNDIARLLG